MRVERRVLNRVEGEIELKLRWKDGVVADAFVSALNYRGFEKFLEGKPALDTLVLTPRVCGICGHAHLMATTRALEDIYKREGVEVKITEKAKSIRAITHLSEIIQNHIRWFYLYLLPDLIKLEPSLRKLYEPLRGEVWIDAVEASKKPIKVIALFGGQWPHTSYSLPGGVMSDPTDVEIGQALSLIESLIEFLEERTLGMGAEEFLERDLLSESGGDVANFVGVCHKFGFDRAGRSYRRFIAGGELEGISSSGVLNSSHENFDIRLVSESEEFTCFSDKGGYTWSKAVRYNSLPHETGPLARQVVSGNRRFLSLLMDYGDSLMVRVLARLEELVRVSLKVRELLQELDTHEDSWIRPPVDIERMSGKGVGVIEAARGTLIHEVELLEGRVRRYNIITPTVWNLGPRDRDNLGVAEKALIGLDSPLKAEIVLRSFDVCSVCTAH